MNELATFLTWILTLPDTFRGCCLVTCFAIIIYCLRRNSLKDQQSYANTGDLAAIGMVVLELVSLPFSQFHPNTLHFIAPYASALCIYFTLRLFFRKSSPMSWFFRGALLLGFLLALSDLNIIVGSIRAASNFSKSDLSALHAVVPLVGASTRNDGLTIVLALLPFSVASLIIESSKRQYLWMIVSVITIIVIAEVLILSFSRGIYFSAFIFAALVATAFVIVRKSSLKISALYFLGICAVLYIPVAMLKVQKPVLDTIYTNKTVSEQRSSFGRVVIWRRVIHDIRSNLALGIGGNNDGLSAIRNFSNDNLPFAAHSYNALLEIAIANGVMGAIAFAWFYATPIVYIFRRIKTSIEPDSLLVYCVVFPSGVVALNIRDITYSSTVMNGASIVLAWSSVALIYGGLARCEQTEVA